MKNVKKNEKKIEKALEAKQELARRYNVSISSIVWCGNNRFIVVTEEGEKRIDLSCSK